MNDTKPSKSNKSNKTTSETKQKRALQVVNNNTMPAKRIKVEMKNNLKKLPVDSVNLKQSVPKASSTPNIGVVNREKTSTIDESIPAYVRTLLTCQSCLFKFNKTDCLPIIVPFSCSKTMCLKCFEKLSKPSFTCPLCNGEHQMPEQGYTVNQLVLELVKEMKASGQNKENIQVAELKCTNLLGACSKELADLDQLVKKSKRAQSERDELAEAISKKTKQFADILGQAWMGSLDKQSSALTINNEKSANEFQERYKSLLKSLKDEKENLSESFLEDQLINDCNDLKAKISKLKKSMNNKLDEHTRWLAEFKTNEQEKEEKLKAFISEHFNFQIETINESESSIKCDFINEKCGDDLEVDSEEEKADAEDQKEQEVNTKVRRSVAMKQPSKQSYVAVCIEELVEDESIMNESIFPLMSNRFLYIRKMNDVSQYTLYLVDESLDEISKIYATLSIQSFKAHCFNKHLSISTWSSEKKISLLARCDQNKFDSNRIFNQAKFNKELHFSNGEEIMLYDEKKEANFISVFNWNIEKQSTLGQTTDKNGPFYFEQKSFRVVAASKKVLYVCQFVSKASLSNAPKSKQVLKLYERSNGECIRFIDLDTKYDTDHIHFDSNYQIVLKHKSEPQFDIFSSRGVFIKQILVPEDLIERGDESQSQCLFERSFITMSDQLAMISTQLKKVFFINL